jgi:hypothetical protein
MGISVSVSQLASRVGPALPPADDMTSDQFAAYMDAQQ